MAVHVVHKRYLALFCCLTLIACIRVGSVGLGGGGEPSAAAPDKVSISGQPQVSLFATEIGRGGATVSLTLAAVELASDGQWVSLLSRPVELSSARAALGGMVDRAQVPAGHYRQMRCRFDKAVLSEGGRRLELRVPSEAVELPLAHGLDLGDGDSVSLFMRWDVAASVAKAPAFVPAITVGEQQVPLTAGLAFVSCPEINTIYLIRTDQNRVCGSWGVSGRPTYLTAFKDRNLLYVLTADQGSIKVIELSSGRLKDQLRIPMAASPSFMAIDPAGRNAFLLDRKTEAIYRLSLESGSLAAQGRIGIRPDFAAFVGDLQRLAVTSEQVAKVFLLEPDSLQVRQIVPVGSGPQGVLSYQQQLYVAEDQANLVSRHSLGSGAALVQPVGLGPSRLLAYDRTIFVANTRGGTISALLPEQLTVAKEIPVGGAPSEMAVSEGHNWLYACDIRDNGVLVVDLTGRKPSARIDLHARPLALTVIQ